MLICPSNLFKEKGRAFTSILLLSSPLILYATFETWIVFVLVRINTVGLF